MIGSVVPKMYISSLMLQPFRSKTVRACALIVCGWLEACTPRTGCVPMAGQRYQSTVCLCGLRGVRVWLESAASGAIDMTISMSADVKALRHCAGLLLAEQTSSESEASGTEPAFRQLDIAHRHAKAQVVDIPGGVRVRIIPASPSDGEAIREEIEARISHASENSQCD